MTHKWRRNVQAWRRYCTLVIVAGINIITLVVDAQNFANADKSSVHFLYSTNAEDENEIQYEYDGLNRVIKAVYPDGTVVRYEYDNNGNLLHTTVIPPEQSNLTEETISSDNGTDSTAGTEGNNIEQENQAAETENAVRTDGDTETENTVRTDGDTGAENTVRTDGDTGTENAVRTDGDTGTEDAVQTDGDTGTKDAVQTNKGTFWLTVCLAAVGVTAAVTLLSFLRNRYSLNHHTKEGEEEHEE